MSRLLTSLPSKNTTVWCTPMATQSPRRSSHRRLNSPCSCAPKTRGIRNNANDNYTRTPYQRTKLPLHHLRSMRRNHNWLNLSSPNRLKIPNRLFISQPHGPCSRGHPDPNTLRLHRGSYSYNRTRTDLLRPILLSEH